MPHPPADSVTPPERLNVDVKKAERGLVERPAVEAFSMALAKADRSSANALPTDSANTVRHEYLKMTLAELANAAVGNESSPRSYAARVEMDRRVAQAQIDAAIAQRDAASAQKATSWAALVFVPAALMGVVIGWLLAKLMGAA
jgi:hypothetical protein